MHKFALTKCTTIIMLMSIQSMQALNTYDGYDIQNIVNSDVFSVDKTTNCTYTYKVLEFKIDGITAQAHFESENKNGCEYSHPCYNNAEIHYNVYCFFCFSQGCRGVYLGEYKKSYGKTLKKFKFKEFDNPEKDRTGYELVDHTHDALIRSNIRLCDTNQVKSSGDCLDKIHFAKLKQVSTYSTTFGAKQIWMIDNGEGSEIVYNPKYAISNCKTFLDDNGACSIDALSKGIITKSAVNGLELFSFKESTEDEARYIQTSLVDKFKGCKGLLDRSSTCYTVLEVIDEYLQIKSALKFSSGTVYRLLLIMLTRYVETIKFLMVKIVRICLLTTLRLWRRSKFLKRTVKSSTK